jgi:hypothetical protein
VPRIFNHKRTTFQSLGAYMFINEPFLTRIAISFVLLGATIPASGAGAQITPLGSAGYLLAQDFGALCDARWNNDTNLLTGTDDRAALRKAMAAAIELGLPLRIRGTCRADPPGGVITAVSIQHDVVTIAMENKLEAADRVVPMCLSAAPFLNGIPLVVLASGLSHSRFQAHLPRPDMLLTAERGGKTVAGRGVWNPIPCPAHSPAVGLSAAFPISKSNLDVAGVSSAASIVGIGIGPFFEYGSDKTAPIHAAHTDSNGTLTIEISGPFPAPFQKGNAVIISETGTALDGTYSAGQIVAATDGTVTIVGAAKNLSAQHGAIHAPWTNGEDDGVQGYTLRSLKIANYNRGASNVDCHIDKAYCAFTVGTAGVVDWRGGSGILENLILSGFEYGFFGVQSDFTFIDNLSVDYSHIGVFIGPCSTPFSGLKRYADYGVERSIEIDGAGDQGVLISDSHLRSGSAASAPFGIVNRRYDETRSSGGGLSSDMISLSDVNFEFGQTGCTNAPHAFISVDSDSGSATATGAISLQRISTVNATIQNSCNVPFLLEVGHADGAPPTISIDHPQSPHALKAWTTEPRGGSAVIELMSPIPAAKALPLRGVSSAPRSYGR